MHFTNNYSWLGSFLQKKKKERLDVYNAATTLHTVWDTFSRRPCIVTHSLLWPCITCCMFYLLDLFGNSNSFSINMIISWERCWNGFKTIPLKENSRFRCHSTIPLFQHCSAWRRGELELWLVGRGGLLRIIILLFMFYNNSCLI